LINGFAESLNCVVFLNQQQEAIGNQQRTIRVHVVKPENLFEFAVGFVPLFFPFCSFCFSYVARCLITGQRKDNLG
jgi:hypothetical protein